MGSIALPETLSGEARRALRLLIVDIDQQFTKLSIAEQNQFWTQLHGYALAQKKRKRQVAPLIAADVDESVRRSLQLIDAAIIRYSGDLRGDDGDRFWAALHDIAERQAEQTKQATGQVRRHSSS